MSQQTTQLTEAISYTELKALTPKLIAYATGDTSLLEELKPKIDTYSFERPQSISKNDAAEYLLIASKLNSTDPIRSALIGLLHRITEHNELHLFLRFVNLVRNPTMPNNNSVIKDQKFTKLQLTAVTQTARLWDGYISKGDSKGDKIMQKITDANLPKLINEALLKCIGPEFADLRSKLGLK